MAQALFNTLKKLFPEVDRTHTAISWGTGIGNTVNLKIVEPLARIGINVTDDSVYFPKDDTHPSLDGKLRHVVRAFTMGCMKNACELPSDVSLSSDDIIDWGLSDPASEDTDVIEVRDKIIGHVLELLVALQN